MKLTLLLEELLLENTIKQFRSDLLDKGLITKDQLENIENEFKKNSNILLYFLKELNKIGKVLTDDEIKKYIDIVKFFMEKISASKGSLRGQEFLKDIGINLTKKPMLILYSFEELEEAYKKSLEKSSSVNTNLIDSVDIAKLKEVKIELLGTVNSNGIEYQVFEVPADAGEEAFNVYRRILGRCKDRGAINPEKPDEKNGIKICTMAGKEHFKNYNQRTLDNGEINETAGPFYVIFSLEDPLSPYQVGFENGQFKDKNDKEYF